MLSSNKLLLMVMHLLMVMLSFGVGKTTSRYGSDASASDRLCFIEDGACDIGIQYKPHLYSTQPVLQDSYTQYV